MASSVAEGVVKLVQLFKLDNLIVLPADSTANTRCHDESTKSTVMCNNGVGVVTENGEGKKEEIAETESTLTAEKEAIEENNNTNVVDDDLLTKPHPPSAAEQIVNNGNHSNEGEKPKESPLIDGSLVNSIINNVSLGEHSSGRSHADHTPMTPDPAPMTPDPAPMTPDPAPRTPDHTPDPAPRTPDHTPRTPDHAPRTPDLAPRTPDPAPRTPDPAPRTPDPAPRTPDPAPTTPDPAPTTPDLAPTTPKDKYDNGCVSSAMPNKESLPPPVISEVRLSCDGWIECVVGLLPIKKLKRPVSFTTFELSANQHVYYTRGA